MKDLEKWVPQGIGKNTIIITNTFHFPDRMPFETIKNEKGKEVFRLYRK